ncbi:MAG: alpha/beta hydrolase [Chloroflexi bacterium]|nr:alpha/beta hydrolase [Chloroflexota bacterium]
MFTLTSLPVGTTFYPDIAYVVNGHERQYLDMYIPATPGPYPVVVWIHGGAFRMGSKADRVPLVMLNRGYAIVAINYRLSQHAIFPAQIEDCKSAVRWLRAHAGEYDLDNTRFVAWGESAGGYLASMLGTCGHVRAWDVGAHLDYSSRVQAVIDFFGPTDFLQMDAQRLPHGMTHNDADSPESQLIGGPIQQHVAAVTTANPITHIDGFAAPFLVIHGDADPLVPHGQSVLLVEALQQQCIPVTLNMIIGGEHGGFDHPSIPL